MVKELYARWMYSWETRLTTRDENRVVRPLEWGFDWLRPFLDETGLTGHVERMEAAGEGEAAMVAVNEAILADSDRFFAYDTPKDFRLEERHPMLFPTNVRPETLDRDARLRNLAAQGKLPRAQFLRFTSPERTPYAENDLVNARWYPADPKKQEGKPKQAMIVMPQWNADAFSHNALCSLFNRFGISALRLSKPYHDIRRPSELERSDYAVSANVGRTLSAVRQAVVDIRCCLDWLEGQGYELFGVLGTSLGSAYGFLASAHDRRLRVNAFNHASAAVGDVVWAGQSTRHIRQALEEAGLTQDRVRALWAGASPVNYYSKFAGHSSRDPRTGNAAEFAKKVLLIYAQYDLTFPLEYSLQVVKSFHEHGIDFERRVLPCGHYTTGETPFQYIDGWYLGSFVYRAFKALREEASSVAMATAENPATPVEEELASR
ncbi:abhydrolase domain-containing 18 [Acidicapsa acidisoli]|uniref:abhydrolase domain-containing 18 n=1 Tax=Acidicapsa acidisoli TaxID=1615681 RepID=UPI0021DFD8F1|nr:abhydrolase domain-containing 18 [Acidicapsa acidisoli]